MAEVGPANMGKNGYVGPIHGRVAYRQRQNGQKESHGELGRVAHHQRQNGQKKSYGKLSEDKEAAWVSRSTGILSRCGPWPCQLCIDFASIRPILDRGASNTLLRPKNVIQGSISFQTGLARECWRGKELTGDKVSPWSLKMPLLFSLFSGPLENQNQRGVPSLVG